MARIRTIKPEEWVGLNLVWPHGCCLYVIQESTDGPVKIGIAEHPIRRLCTLQSGNSRPLNLIAVFAADRKECRRIEYSLINLFRYERLKGEWFSLKPEVVISRMGQIAEASK